ncbi:MAG: amidohydrolase family protein, partial [Lentisphaerota bacterium]
RLALEALEEAVRAHPDSARLRHQLAHLDLMSLEDLSRMAALGVIANLQPAWFYMDHGFFDSFIPYLGLERANRMYPIRSLLDAGVRVACGSDWPFGGDNSNFNPLESIAVGATRTGLGDALETPYAPEQCVKVSSLINGYTLEAAFSNFMEDETGSITPGKKADLAVLDRNLPEIPPHEIAGAKVLMTFFEGKPVFRDPSL